MVYHRINLKSNAIKLLTQIQIIAPQIPAQPAEMGWDGTSPSNSVWEAPHDLTLLEWNAPQGRGAPSTRSLADGSSNGWTVDAADKTTC
jgi:hypothetical protein